MALFPLSLFYSQPQEEQAVGWQRLVFTEVPIYVWMELCKYTHCNTVVLRHPDSKRSGEGGEPSHLEIHCVGALQGATAVPFLGCFIV